MPRGLALLRHAGAAATLSAADAEQAMHIRTALLMQHFRLDGDGAACRLPRCLPQPPAGTPR